MENPAVRATRGEDDPDGIGQVEKSPADFFRKLYEDAEYAKRVSEERKERERRFREMRTRKTHDELEMENRRLQAQLEALRNLAAEHAARVARPIYILQDRAQPVGPFIEDEKPIDGFKREYEKPSVEEPRGRKVDL